MRPWAAQSNSSRPPSVKALCFLLPSISTRVSGCFARSSSAAEPGMGDELPTAMVRQPSSRR